MLWSFGLSRISVRVRSRGRFIFGMSVRGKDTVGCRVDLGLVLGLGS